MVNQWAHISTSLHFALILAYDPWTSAIDSVWKTRRKLDFSQITDSIILETGVSKTVIIEDILRRTNNQVQEILFAKLDEDCYVHGPSIGEA